VLHYSARSATVVRAQEAIRRWDAMTGVWCLATETGPRWAVGEPSAGPARLLSRDFDLDDLLSGSSVDLEEAAATHLTDDEPPESARILPPIGSQEVWAAGVTFERSLTARKEETVTADVYDAVYLADRPELFFKSTAHRVSGTGEPIGIRADSTWDVPEPELAVVFDRSGAVVAYTLGNDVSSRSIEGENPLYLPQAKVYTDSCAVGPCLVPATQVTNVSRTAIQISIERAGRGVLDEVVPLSGLRRSIEELGGWLFRSLDFDCGVYLLTGTGFVPSSDFSLEPGDRVSISVDGLGRLENEVRRVGRPTSE
jgi:2-dehydro-3-deoxy-D-arabinonate dehydratase